MASVATLLRPELAALKTYNAGLTIDEVRSRCGGRPVAKLASNENPYPLAADVTEAIRRATETVHLYPDPQGRKLTAMLSDLIEIEQNNVILGDGSEDLLNVLARCLLRAGDEIVTLYPSFPLHSDYAQMMGARVNYVALTADGKIDIAALAEAAARPVRLTILANPMNPTGLWLTPVELDRLLEAQHPDSILCIDEAYVEYAEGPDFGSTAGHFKSHRKPLLVLRTFSKAYGLAGLRIGYGLSNSTELVRGMHLVRTPFNVNAVAQAAAIAALRSPASMRSAVATVVTERERVRNALEGLSVRVLPSKANFLFVEHRLPSLDLADRLITDGVLIKPWKQSGYENWFRVSIGLPSENDQFLSAMLQRL